MIESRFSDKAATWRNPLAKPKPVNLAKLREARARFVALNPWTDSFYAAKARCNNRKNPNYPRYGGAGIEFRLTMEQMRMLWHRDNAASMKRPSIDRIMSGGHYEVSNCRFLELSDNCSKRFNPDYKERRQAKHLQMLLQKRMIIASFARPVAVAVPATIGPAAGR